MSSWGYISYSRVSVKIDLARQLQRGVWIMGLQERFFQRIEYEGLSHICFNYGYIGHKIDSCPTKNQHHAPSKQAIQQPSAEVQPNKTSHPTQHAPQWTVTWRLMIKSPRHQDKNAKIQDMDEISNIVLNLKKQWLRVSKQLEKELQQRGPIASLLRKRKKASDNIMGGESPRMRDGNFPLYDL
ncbi:hypothetical protein M5K25_009604 [Dendrobium thyrsiflorum]|uniref:Zinc knuckle CX2CX4HX4C domain-containing protein n=1 Tax=Dendrobium thyrsiflorum TaxID=117978 RepID=A0ABD0V6P1_DENTH